MEDVKDSAENNQNTKRLFIGHENSSSSTTGKSADNKVFEQTHNWSSFGQTHSWVVAAAAMQVSHFNNNNNNNNNNHVQNCDNLSDVVGFDFTDHKTRQEVFSGCSNWAKQATQTAWNCVRCDALSMPTAAAPSIGTTTSISGNYTTTVDSTKPTQHKKCDTALSKLAALVIHDAPLSPTCTTSGACCIDYNDSDAEDQHDEHYAIMGATALSVATKEAGAESSADLLQSIETAGLAACAPTHSNRTSINNSTENLSYASDNFYANDLMLLDDNADLEPEEISLNSDDCIYAYRGDGSDFELALDDVLNRRQLGAIGPQANDLGNNSAGADDETDFLEMDFEPDPLSEAEYATNVLDMAANTFLMQRNSCHLSGRHSAANSLVRQHFSSPTEDLPILTKALQAQTMLSKNFACINLHLDQINETLTVANDNTHTLAQSLPNTLHEHFALGGNENPLSNRNSVEQLHVSKLTGAKPKLATNTAVKQSNKTRSSRSAMGATYIGSNSFDERSLSCNEFRATGLEVVTQQSVDCLVAAPLIGVAEQNSDEACLDCLEREFLANTIGKSLEPHKECVRCHKRSSSNSITLYENAQKLATRSRSITSPHNLFFEQATQMDCSLFDAANEFLCETLPVSVQNWSTHLNEPSAAIARSKFNPNSFNLELSQRDTQSFHMQIGEQLLKNVLPTIERKVTVPTVNLCEDSLILALNKLNIIYNQELLRNYFMHNSNIPATPKPTQPLAKQHFKNLKHFLLHEAKRQGNYRQLRRLIQVATKSQVTVNFKQWEKSADVEMIPVKVADILYQWTQHKDLSILKQLGRRFAEANVLGKIANLIRQTQQRCAMRRALPEFITIPQYYASGELIITKKF